MNRVEQSFADLRRRSGKGVMPFICGGHPGPGDTGRALLSLERAGAAVVEVGIPFSDPIADGPVIAKAMTDALAAGAAPRSVMSEVAAVRGSISIGVVAMVSVSLVWKAGYRRFVAEAADAGFDGFIFPDLPLEESDELLAVVRNAGLTASLLVGPRTPPDRAARIAAASSGFVYLIARTGITGERGELPEIETRIERLRRETDLPIACGFGISTADQVAAVCRFADAAIVGSALVRRMADAAGGGGDPAGAAGAFCGELAAGIGENRPRRGG